MTFPVPFAFLAAWLSLTLLMRQIWKKPYFERLNPLIGDLVRRSH